MQDNSQRSQHAPQTEPETGRPPRRYHREIDCAPERGASGPSQPGTGRGRGTPDPERWTRDTHRPRD